MPNLYNWLLKIPGEPIDSRRARWERWLTRSCARQSYSREQFSTFTRKLSKDTCAKQWYGALDYSRHALWMTRGLALTSAAYIWHWVSFVVTEYKTLSTKIKPQKYSKMRNYDKITFDSFIEGFYWTQNTKVLATPQLRLNWRHLLSFLL